MFVCLKPVAAVIVAPRWASYSLTTWLSQIPQIQQFDNSYFFPNPQSHHRFRHYNCHQTQFSVPYGAQKKSPSERVKREPLTGSMIDQCSEEMFHHP
jgi:hypothetical protein